MRNGMMVKEDGTLESICLIKKEKIQCSSCCFK